MVFLACVCAALASVASPSIGAGLATARASITLHLGASADRALPMFDPVNEARWSPDWHPTLLGDARIASGLVFTTQDESGRAVWLLDRYDPQAREIRYVTVRSSTLTTIDIAVKQNGSDASIATVAYARTALDRQGAQEVETFEQHFSNQGPHWESAINSALAAK